MTDEAIQTIEKRNRTHGDFVEQAQVSQNLKNVLVLGEKWSDLTDPEREALEMICVKLSRIVSGDPHEPDHWLDISGYSELGRREALKANIVGREE